MVNYSTLDRRFAALADPTRRAILDRLSSGEAPVSELAAPFGMSLPGFLKHLSVLENAGLLKCRKSGRVRRCRLEPKAVAETISWLEARQEVWEKRLDSLEKVVHERSKR